ncbi:hypothetical protein DV740_05960 [Roseburia sp. AF02-12]|uniref:hypothetical protein n=1 Tax=Roseburia sp. AF02-12 TaxID=2293126 RepID=UPI000E47CC7A|nr:hypothetical protein [Roseburia sp. AF02-12]RGH30947.1 hypothetical protein DV740_05960 [Roseburia sp. AF02-12]
MIGEYEEVHSHADMYPIDMMVGYLRSTMILGGMLVVATCGMALPLVATVGVMAIGAGTAAYGFSNTVEGGQDVYAGVTGDPRMVSVN